MPIEQGRPIIAIPICQLVSISITATKGFTLSGSANLLSKLSYRADCKRRFFCYTKARIADESQSASVSFRLTFEIMVQRIFLVGGAYAYRHVTIGGIVRLSRPPITRYITLVVSRHT